MTTPTTTTTQTLIQSSARIPSFTESTSSISSWSWEENPSPFLSNEEEEVNSVDGFWIPNNNEPEEWAWIEEEKEEKEEKIVKNWSWMENPSFLDDNSLSWNDGWNYQEAARKSSGQQAAS